MKKNTLSLCMIVKNEANSLPILWASVKNVVDEWIVVDTGSTDDTPKIARDLGAKVFEAGEQFCETLTKEHVKFFEKYGVQVKEGEKVFHFGKARNFSFKQATKDYILWLDADDVLVNSAKMQRIIDENLDPKKQLGLHLLYKYELDEYLNSIVEHYRERVVPNNGTFEWHGRIHEIIVPTLETEYIHVKGTDCHVLHTSEGERKRESGERNTKSLLLDLFEQGKNQDPRTLFFLAESLKIAGHLEKSLELFKDYIKLSGWDEERCLASVRISSGYMVKGDYSTALKWAFNAVKERPDFPMGYSAACQAYFALDEFAHAERFAKHALDTEQPQTLIMVDDKYNRFIPMFVLAETFLKQCMYKEAHNFATEALKYEPQNKDLFRIAFTCERMIQENDIVKAVAKITKFLIDSGEIEKAESVIKNIPAYLVSDPRVQQMSKEIQGEIEKRSSGWITEEKRLEVGKPIDIQYRLLDTDLKKFDCKSILLISNEPLLAQSLKNAGYHVKRTVTIDKITQGYDAVCFDYNLHMVRDREKFLERGVRHATKLVTLCVPNKDPRALIQATVELVESWLEKNTTRSFNVMPLNNGVIYGCGVLDSTRKSKVTFFCGGQSTEEWGPMSHIDGGCGGSEEATIYLSQELARLGHEVEVINSYPHPCHVDGVKWRHLSTLKPNEEFDNLILWRTPHHLDDYNLKAKKTFLWMHDVPIGYWFKPERMKKIDTIWVLSEYHKSLLPKQFQDKAIVSANGVDVRQFNVTVTRDPRKVIYTSSYDRGLEHLLKIWPDVKKEVPTAELHVYYGWGTFDKLRMDEKNRQWKSWMMEQLQREGVFEHGRVDQLTLAKELKSSSIFAYPCHFEEISCISAMKAQVAGCIPLTTGYAALAETNLTEFKVEGNPKDAKVLEEFKEQLIKHLKSDMEKYREGISKNAKDKFTWTAVAKQWSGEFSRRT